MARNCFALDLKDDPHLIAAYDAWHEQVWPEILASLKAAGIESLEIYRTGNRLFMIMETNATYSSARKAALDANNPRVREWENLMWTYQQPLPQAQPGEKWISMREIFSWRST